MIIHKFKRQTTVWPSFETAQTVYDWANIFLVVTLAVGVISTVLVVWMGKIKETYLTRELASTAEHTEQLRADNLSLQTVLSPRHVGLIGFDGEPKAKLWFAGIEKFAGTQISIQVVSDREAHNLANEIAIVLSKFGWKPRFADEKEFSCPVRSNPRRDTSVIPDRKSLYGRRTTSTVVCLA